MTIIINPGTGNVFGADQKHAAANMDVWVKEIPDCLRWSWDYNEQKTEKNWNEYPNMARGRYTFDVIADLEDGRHFDFEVEMPGLPIDKVRYVNKKNQNIWDFPRLYVDGSSWVWLYSFVDFEQEA